MSTVQANIVGLMLNVEALVQNSESSTLYQEFALSELNITSPAFNSGDTIQIGGGGNDRGQATTLTLQQIIQNERRDGRTVTIKAAMIVQPGYDGTTYFYLPAAGATVSTGNLTFIPKQFDEATSVAGANGITQPMRLIVRYTLN
jgi:hypothetical protein